MGPVESVEFAKYEYEVIEFTLRDTSYFEVRCFWTLT